MESPEKLLIIGSRHPLGPWISWILLRDGLPCVLLDRVPWNPILPLVIDPGSLPSLPRVFGDLADPDAVARIVRQHEITRIIHLDGDGGERRGRPGSLAVAFEGAGASRGKVAGMVYALRDGEDAGEISRKAFADHGVPSIGLRPVAAYGVGQEVGFGGALTRAIKAAVLGRCFEIPFLGGEEGAYVEDVARAFVACALSGARAALTGRPRAEEIGVKAFIEKLSEAVPESAGKITEGYRSSPRVRAKTVREPPTVSLEAESSLDPIPELRAIPSTPLSAGIWSTADLFRKLAEEGRLRKEDLSE